MELKQGVILAVVTAAVLGGVVFVVRSGIFEDAALKDSESTGIVTDGAETGGKPAGT